VPVIGQAFCIATAQREGKKQINRWYTINRDMFKVYCNIPPNAEIFYSVLYWSGKRKNRALGTIV
jgi:hypothetical protein